MMHLKGQIHSVWLTANGFSNFLWNKVISMESKSHLFQLARQWGKPENFSSLFFPSLGSSKVLISEWLCLWTRYSPLMQSFSLAFHLARRNLFQEVLWAYQASSPEGPQIDKKVSVFQTVTADFLQHYRYPLMLHKSEKAQIHKDFFAALYIKVC